METLYSEPHLEERIIAAKERARRIKYNINITNLEDAEMILRFVLSRHYNIPLFDKYFDERTLDELFFEAELVLPEKVKTPEDISDTIKENQDEVSKLTDEFEEWIDRSDAPLDPAAADDPFFKLAKQFMETDEFIGVNSNQAPNVDIGDNNEERTDLD